MRRLQETHDAVVADRLVIQAQIGELTSECKALSAQVADLKQEMQTAKVRFRGPWYTFGPHERDLSATNDHLVHVCHATMHACL